MPGSKWDWVDPLKDRKAEIEAIEAGLKSMSDVIESEGYDAEEVDRRIAADHAREEELGLSFGRQAQGGMPADGGEPGFDELKRAPGSLRVLHRTCAPWPRHSTG
jgi:hypothetical protein